MQTVLYSMFNIRQSIDQQLDMMFVYESSFVEFNKTQKQSIYNIVNVWTNNKCNHPIV